MNKPGYFKVMGVDVFDVGLDQVQDFIDQGGVYVPLIVSRDIRVGTYLIVYRNAEFGRLYDEVTLYPGYRTLWDAYEALPDMFTEYPVSGGYALGRDIEIWRVCGDDYLYLDWQCASARYLLLFERDSSVIDADYLGDSDWQFLDSVREWVTCGETFYNSCYPDSLSQEIRRSLHLRKA